MERWSEFLTIVVSSFTGIVGSLVGAAAMRSRMRRETTQNRIDQRAEHRRQQLDDEDSRDRLDRAYNEQLDRYERRMDALERTNAELRGIVSDLEAKFHEERRLREDLQRRHERELAEAEERIEELTSELRGYIKTNGNAAGGTA